VRLRAAGFTPFRLCSNDRIGLRLDGLMLAVRLTHRQFVFRGIATMKRWVLAFVLLLTSPAWAQISSQFFGDHVIFPTTPWPSTLNVQFSSWRSVSSSVKWSDINTAPGVYNWTTLDQWLAKAQQYDQSVLYTFYFTPAWASQCPLCTCNSGNQPPGGCYPPNDLNADGSGTDLYLKNFITALMQHVGPGKIKYIEIWNEPNIPAEYMGTVQQLVTMARDVRTVARSYDPNIQIISPPETGDGPNSSEMLYLASYLSAGGGAYVDIIGLHGYVQNPEDVITRVNNTVQVMQQYGQNGKPIFVTEASWCVAHPCNSGPPPSAQQPGFMFRHYLSMLSTPVQKFYMYAFDSSQEGNFWNIIGNALTPNATAYQLFYSWLVGSIMTQPCQAQSASTPIWTCTFTEAQGTQAEAIWDTGLAFGKTISVTVPSQYVQYLDLYGHVYPIKNHQVPIGYTPIWLQN